MVVELKDELFKNTICGCPHCKNMTYIKHGSYKGIQRYKCNSCGKTFSSRTNSPWYYSKKSNEMWECFWKLQMNMTSLLNCSKGLKINVATAFNWRHKILKALEYLTEPTVLSPAVSITKRIIPENSKGSFRPYTNKINKIWYAVAADVNDHVLVKPFSLNMWNKTAFNNLIYNKINTNSVILTFGDQYIFNATKLNSPYYENGYIDEDGSPEDFIPENIYVAKNLVLRTLDCFNEIKDRAFGISTKYLNHYFSLAKIFSMKKGFSISSVLHRYYDKCAYIKCSEIKLSKAI